MQKKLLVGLPPPSISAFSFEDGGDEGEVGTFSPSMVHPDTPSKVTDAWNTEKKVNCVLMDSNWCLAAYQGTDPDFKACTLVPMSRGGDCRKALHEDVRGKPVVLRMDVSDPFGVYGIVCPTSGTTVKQTMCFSSRPTFKLSSFPESLRDALYHEVLLTFRFRPAVWKVLFEGYPGEDALMRMISPSPTEPPPLSLPTSGDGGINNNVAHARSDEAGSIHSGGVVV